MDINRSGFYKWKKRIESPGEKQMKRESDIKLFLEYHNKYPSHGYRWLNAKIKLDTGTVYSDNYAFRCCHHAGIKSKAKHSRYKKPKDASRIYPNLLLEGIAPDEPYKVIVSDMTAFRSGGTYYEITFYMDLFNNEIVAYGLSSRKGDRQSYYDGLEELVRKKKEYQDLETILHTDQGSVYSSKDYNNLLPLHHIIHSMSKAGTPTDNAAMESINGWAKEELFTDFHIDDREDVESYIPEYIRYFNEERPAYSLKYLTPKQYKEEYFSRRHEDNKGKGD
jgi:transposase InsO family protein